MKPEIKTAIDKLKIVKNLAQYPETRQICDIVIELTEALQEEDQLGFKGKDEGKQSNK